MKSGSGKSPGTVSKEVLGLCAEQGKKIIILLYSSWSKNCSLSTQLPSCPMAGRRGKTPCCCYHVFPEPAGVTVCERGTSSDLQMPQDLSGAGSIKSLQGLLGPRRVSQPMFGAALAPGLASPISSLCLSSPPPPSLVTRAWLPWPPGWLCWEVPLVMYCLCCRMIVLLFLYVLGLGFWGLFFKGEGRLFMTCYKFPSFGVAVSYISHQHHLQRQGSSSLFWELKKGGRKSRGVQGEALKQRRDQEKTSGKKAGREGKETWPFQ